MALLSTIAKRLGQKPEDSSFPEAPAPERMTVRMYGQQKGIPFPPESSHGHSDHLDMRLDQGYGPEIKLLIDGVCNLLGLALEPEIRTRLKRMVIQQVEVWYYG